MASPPRARVAIATAATGILLSGPASAQEPAAPPPPQAATAPTPPPAPPAAAPQRARPAPAARAGRGRPAPPPKAKRVREVLPPDGTPIASFPGFSRLDDGKTRIFVEVSRKVEVIETRGPGRLVYRLRGATVVQRTNQMALLTGFFSTPVDRVQLVQVGPDLDVVIELREATTPTYLVTETPRGMVLWVDFPRSAGFGRDDGPTEPGRPRAKRSTTSQTIGGSAPADDAPPPVDDH